VRINKRTSHVTLVLARFTADDLERRRLADTASGRGPRRPARRRRDTTPAAVEPVAEEPDTGDEDVEAETEDAAPATTAAKATKQPAKKTTAKKTPAKKTTAKKKTPAKKTPAKKAGQAAKTQTPRKARKPKDES